MGEADETLIIEHDGPEMSIGFNARYLLDFLNVVDTETVRLEFNPAKPGEDGRGDPGDKPGQMRPEPEGDMDYRYIVMPMHL